MTSPGDASLIRPPLWSGWRPGEEGGEGGHGDSKGANYDDKKCGGGH